MVLSWAGAKLRTLVTVPLWFGGLHPGTTVVVVNTRPNGRGTYDKLFQGQANDSGYVDARLSRRLRGRPVQVRVLSTWFKNQTMSLRVESHGLVHAIALEQDFAYVAGEAISEDVPPETVGWDPSRAIRRPVPRPSGLAGSK